MTKEIENILTEGLQSGYAGKGEITPVQREGFQGSSSHFESPDGTYHDEWFTPNHLGGGQELVRAGESKFTRLYGGGTASAEILEKLGITDSDVNAYLKRKIIELGSTTRLFEECRPEPDGDWQYLYELLLRDPNIPVLTFAESILYKGTRVHLHPFILTPLS